MVSFTLPRRAGDESAHRVSSNGERSRSGEERVRVVAVGDRGARVDLLGGDDPEVSQRP